MEISALSAGNFKLDGGAMFGVVPKRLWQNQNPPDANNLCTWIMRSLLIKEGNRAMLVDTGMGGKQNPKFFSFYEPSGPTLEESLAAQDLHPTDITDVWLTHLHFDHCGGAIHQTPDGKLLPTFPNAKYWVHSQHWEWATHPNPREKASFLPENILPILESGQLCYLDKTFPDMLKNKISMFEANGHTEKQALPLLTYKGRTLAFMGDLIPSAWHIAPAWIMAYDMRPLVSMEEKNHILTLAAEQNWILIFEHDPTTQAATVWKTDKGIQIKERFLVSEI